MQASYVATNAEVAPSLGRNLAACGTRVPCTATTTVNLIEPFTVFEDRIYQVDVRLAKTIRIQGLRLQATVDVYNALNASPILAINTRYGPQWLVPQQILDGRLLKVGAQLTF